MSQTSSHTLGSCRMRCFLQPVVFRADTDRPKLGVFSNFSNYRVFCCFITQLFTSWVKKQQKNAVFWKVRKNTQLWALSAHPKNNNLKKTPHSITSQCIGRSLGHLAAHMKDFIKMGAKSKFWKFRKFWWKFPNIA